MSRVIAVRINKLLKTDHEGNYEFCFEENLYQLFAKDWQKYWRPETNIFLPNYILFSSLSDWLILDIGVLNSRIAHSVLKYFQGQV